MKKIIILIGIPASGKSTFTNQIKTEHTLIISSLY